MKEYQRKGLLERLNRDGATIGARIPERVEVDGEAVALRELVLDATPDERRQLDSLRTALRRAHAERRQQVAAGEVAYAEAERLTEEALGIDRALTALERSDPVGLEEEAARSEAADRKRWLSFLDRVRGKDERRRRR